MHPIDNFVCIKPFILYSLFNSEFRKTYWYLTIWFFQGKLHFQFCSLFWLIQFLDCMSFSRFLYYSPCCSIWLYCHYPHASNFPSPNPPLSVLWVQGGAWLIRSLLWSCSYVLPYGHRFNCISCFPGFWVLVCILILQSLSIVPLVRQIDTYEGIAWFNSVFHQFITASGLHSIWIRNHILCAIDPL